MTAREFWLRFVAYQLAIDASVLLALYFFQ